MDTLRGLEWGGVPVVVEVLGWDEAFLGPGEGHGALGDPGLREQSATAVPSATRLNCGVGIGNNKLRAKIATAFGKPRGAASTVTDAEWYDEMGDRPTRALWGVGAKIAGRLAALGIQTVRELAVVTPRCSSGSSGRPWGRGSTGSVAGSTPAGRRDAVGRRARTGARRPTRSDLEWDAVPDACAR